jgi:hypothetical protein
MFRENETPEVLPKSTPGFRPSQWIRSESLVMRGRAMSCAFVLERMHAAALLCQPHPAASEANVNQS